MSNICPCTLGNSVAGALFNLKHAKELTQLNQEAEQTACAEVLSRRVETVYSLMRSDSSWGYFVTFRGENGEELRLKTTEENYVLLKEGCRFSITWKGDSLLRFAEKD